MSNMSYCRFENTLHDLQDCYDHIEENLSGSEFKARARLIELANDLARMYPSPDWEELKSCDDCGDPAREADLQDNLCEACFKNAQEKLKSENITTESV